MAIGHGCGTRFLGSLFWWPRCSWGGLPVSHCNNCLDEEPPSWLLVWGLRQGLCTPKFLCSMGSNTWYILQKMWFILFCLPSSWTSPSHMGWPACFLDWSSLHFMLEKWLMIFMNGWCPSALSSSDSLFSYFYSSRHFRGNWRRAGALNEFTETVLNQKSVMIF